MSQGRVIITARPSSFFGRLCIQPVIEPAPVPTIARARLDVRRHGGGEIVLAVDGDDIAMAMGAQRLGIAVAVDAFDRLLARGIDRRDDRHIGVVEAGGELLEGVAQAGVAMRLHHRHDRAAIGLARGLDGGGDLEGIVGVIVDDGGAVHFAHLGEAAADAAEFGQRLA